MTNTHLEEQNLERYGVRGQGWDIGNLDVTTEDEIQSHLHQWVNYTRERGIYYGLNALSFMADTRPDLAKLAAMSAGGIPDGLFGHPARAVLQNCRNLAEYIRLGWESGIYNEFRELQMRGQTREEIIELVMYAQMTGGGIRSMGHVHNAVAKSWFDWQDGDGAVYPEGWEADTDAFKCGLDMSTAQLTDDDRRNLEDWYERTIGFVPKSVRFAIKHNPRYIKVQRARWERVFKVLPKQMAPYMMLSDQALRGNVESLQEAALLGKAWGMTADWVLEAVCGMVFYFRGHEGLEPAFDALDEILDNWDN